MIDFNFELDEKKEGALTLMVDEKKVGFMDIKIKGKELIVFHTEVFPEGQGKGYAGKLFDQLVSYARENKLKIVALCPYVHARFEKDPKAYEDVWSKTEK